MRLGVLVPVVATVDAGAYRINANYGRLIDGLAKYFREVEVLAVMPAKDDGTYYPGGSSLYKYPIAASNVRITRVAVSLPTDHPCKKAIAWLQRIPSYWRAIRASDVAYVAMPGFSGLMASVVCRALGKPYILYYGADWRSFAPFIARWGAEASPALLLYRRFASWAEGIPIRQSLFTLAAGRLLQERLTRYGPRVFETRPMLAVGRDDFFERADTCGSTPVRALYVGTLLPGKGVQYLIDSMADLRDRQMAITLTLVGVGEQEYSAQLRGLVADRGLSSAVTFAGFVSDVDTLLNLYRHADLLVLPTLSEGFPRVLYEAMSQSLPVVTTSIPPIAEALRADEEAVLVRPGSSRDLADGIERVVRDDVLRGRLIVQGRAFAASRITPSTTADQVAQLTAKYLSAPCLQERLHEWARTYYSHSDAYRQRLASKWTDEWRGIFAAYVDPLVAGCPPGALVLDLGCGAGQTSSMVESAGLRVVGADLFLGALAAFPGDLRTERLHRVNCDAARLPFAREAFHAVGAYTVLEHVADAEMALDEMLRVLRPGGRLVVSGPNMLSPFHATRLWLRGLRTGSFHPDGSIRAILWNAYSSLRKAASRGYSFLYREPRVKGLDFPGSDYDAICMVNPIDLVRWSRSRNLEVSRISEARSSAGRVVQALMPYLAGGICLVARKGGQEPP